MLAAADSTIVVHHGDKETIERLSFRDALPGEIVIADNGSTDATAIVAADHGADVANISFGIANYSTVTNAAQYMRNRGGVVLTSAGNANTNKGYSDDPYIIHVAATTSSDARARSLAGSSNGAP